MPNPFTAPDIDYTDQRSALIVGAQPSALDAANRAAGFADLRSVASVGFVEAGGFLAQSAAPDVILVELADTEPAVAEPALAAIDMIARERDIDIVVALSDDQVDLVASRLFGRHAQLLCSPSVAERVAALRWAGGLRSHRLHDSVTDADERLRRLNAEVARFAETLSQLATDRAQPRASVVRAAPIGFRGEPVEPPVATDPGDVRDMIRSRRMRAAHFPEGLFADPAWDMLLDLFAAELEHRRVSVSSLCIAAAVPGTTALRWIGSLVEAQVFERYADPHDRRRAFISLSDSARQGMQRYFAAVRRAGLPPA